MTAIFVDRGSYSGLIDLGELRGAEPEFDLGHLLLHDQETDATALFAHFRDGHAEVSGATSSYDTVRQVAILVGLRHLCYRDARRVPRNSFTRLRAAQLRNLLEGRPAGEPRPSST